MTNQEAINVMQKYINSDTISPVVQEAHNMAINALEKQVSKKPIHDEYKHKCCPSCGYCGIYKDEWGGRYIPHCENCGQAIDWSDDDAKD